MLNEIICVSDWQRKMLGEYRLPREKMITIHNGVDLSRFDNVPPVDLPGPAEAPAIVQVANIMPDKDFGTLLSAAVVLKDRGIVFCLYLVGRGTDSPVMHARINELDLREHVFPLGPRNDVPVILSACDVFVLSTRSEVFNIAVLEAMAAGLPVIASDVPGFTEMFDTEVQGLKTPPGDPAALADAIRRLLADESLRAKLAETARIHVKKFSRENMCDEFEAYLQS